MRCESTIRIGEYKVQCELTVDKRTDEHKGRHQADIKVERVYDELSTDGTATVVWR